jgi:hypothetical protein
MKLWPYLLAAVILLPGVFGTVYFLGSHPGGKRSGVSSKTAWQRMASPGALSRSHTFLEHNCAACHTSVKGAEAGKCILCHANDESLLQREPTAFHANVSSCRECHREHQGIGKHPTDMDHLALAEIGLRMLESERRIEQSDPVLDDLLKWIARGRAEDSPGSPRLTPHESVLNCASCHSTKDQHSKLFGEDCASCHGTTKWAIPEFHHPSPRSTECAQCHQAPPSHYMMHFSMISAKVAKQPTARVDQCFLCHQTTVWNDIKGVGYYKHH